MRFPVADGGAAGGARRGRDEILRLIDAAARSAFRRRLGRRAYLALGALAAAWGAASLAAALWDYGATAYYAILLSAAGLAWPILAWPPSGEPFAAMIRAADAGASIESYLSARNRVPNETLKAAALATLRTADFMSAEKASAGGGATARRARFSRLATALCAAGLALFVAAQALSLRAGMGYGLGYPDRSALAAPRDLDAELRTGGVGDGAGRAEPTPDDGSAAVADAPRSAAAEAERTPALPERRVTGSRLGRDPEGGNERPPEATGSPEAGEAAAAGEGSGGGRKASDGPPGSPEPREGIGPAGFEGAGRALDPGPLGDYRARIERLLEERGGLERALGELSSPALAQAALEAYYGSFERRIRTEPAAELGFQALREAWAAMERERTP